LTGGSLVWAEFIERGILTLFILRKKTSLLTLRKRTTLSPVFRKSIFFAGGFLHFQNSGPGLDFTFN